jgi:hypothetical protein
MPIIRMPTGELVDMPDNPTPEQLDALDEINKAAPSPLSQKLNQYQVGGIPLVSSKGIASDLAHGAGLAGRAAINGLTGLSGMVANLPFQAYNAITGKNSQLPTDAQSEMMDKYLGKPQTGLEKGAVALGSLAVGSRDPLMMGLSSKIMGPKPLYKAPPPPSPTSVKADTIAEARAAGLKIPPSMAQGSVPARFAEDLSSKPQVARMANAANIDTLNAIAAKEAGLPAGTPLTHDTLNTAINQTYKEGYGPLADLGTITTGSKYRKALDSALEEYNNMEKSFPGTGPQEIPDVVNKYRVRSFDSTSIAPTLEQLRKDSSAAYQADKPAVGRAYKNVANAIEDAIDLNVAKRQPDLIKDFRAARRLIAKQAAVRDMVVEGSGNVNPATLAARYGKHPERYTEGLATIGKFAKAFPQLARPNAVPPPLFTNPELAMMGGSPLTAMMGGNPAGLTVATIPLARMAARQTLLSPFMQNHMALTAQQTPGWLAQAMRNPNVINAMPTAEQLMQNGLYGGDNGQ